MLDISKSVIDLISADVVVNTLIGGEDGERIYSWNPPEDVAYSTENKAAIFYKLITGRRDSRWSFPTQYPDVTFYFRLVSLDELTVNQLGELLIAMFDEQSLDGDVFTIKKIHQSFYSDGPIEGTSAFPLYVKNLSFNFSDIFDKSKNSP